MDRLTILMTCILLLCAGTLKVRAQNDPVLAGMILLYTDKAQKELKSQEKVMLLQTTGHIWTKEEIEGTTDLQREFNDYLDSFRSIVCYAAQTYGFYHEISRLTDNLGDFSQQLARHPSNALAVALSSRRNKIYRELILGSVDIVNTGAAGTPLTTADKALLTVDVWEHAYYIDYRNMRPKFVETFLDKLVNWKFAEANFA